MNSLTPTKERALRAALRNASQSDLVDEAYRVIGREKSELRKRAVSGRDLLIEHIITLYSGSTASDEARRKAMVARLGERAERRVRRAMA